MFQASKYVNVKNDKCQICHESHESNPMSLSDKKSVKNGCRKILLWTKYAMIVYTQSMTPVNDIYASIHVTDQMRWCH